MTNFAAPMSKAEVRDARLALGFQTQQALADALGLEGTYSKDTIRSWESGKNPISGPARVALRLMLERQKADA